ncbi:hypothetical protein [Planobispora rosea]|uniref:hypothetical protein n=1 Tax=Planobispora rosea TaxID=35762 RepID=UPI000839F934|nr:hypothetical protein [Planobispora rosea]
MGEGSIVSGSGAAGGDGVVAGAASTGLGSAGGKTTGGVVGEVAGAAVMPGSTTCCGAPAAGGAGVSVITGADAVTVMVGVGVTVTVAAGAGGAVTVMVMVGAGVGAALAGEVTAGFATGVGLTLGRSGALVMISEFGASGESAIARADADDAAAAGAAGDPDAISTATAKMPARRDGVRYVMAAQITNVTRAGGAGRSQTAWGRERRRAAGKDTGDGALWLCRHSTAVPTGAAAGTATGMPETVQHLIVTPLLAIPSSPKGPIW